VLLIVHNAELAGRADRVLLLEDGTATLAVEQVAA
jgi:predicted ABC-type transport system involved in lysophospholipase L1 biosynthesis ATPase subunit